MEMAIVRLTQQHVVVKLNWFVTNVQPLRHSFIKEYRKRHWHFENLTAMCLTREQTLSKIRTTNNSLGYNILCCNQGCCWLAKPEPLPDEILATTSALHFVRNVITPSLNSVLTSEAWGQSAPPVGNMRLVCC